jgi:hypothetical protein
MRKYRSFFRDELTFSSESLITRSTDRALDFIRRQQYDAIYVGSDTVLELKNCPPDGLTPYWLDSTVCGAKVFAAASSHSVTAGALSERQKYLMASTLNSFSLMGVRDHATRRLLSQFVGETDNRLRLVPDPTFSFDIDYSHIERYLVQNRPSISGPIVCLHLLRDSTWAGTLADRFRHAGYAVASLRPARYADILFTDLSPFEQLGLYQRFSLVITHRFHDAIFCLKNKTPVMVFPENVSDVTPHGESKIATLLKGFGLDATSYLPDRREVNADYLYERHRDAVAAFEAGRDRIDSVLSAHKAAYIDFIGQSRAFVN